MANNQRKQYDELMQMVKSWIDKNSSKSKLVSIKDKNDKSNLVSIKDRYDKSNKQTSKTKGR